MEMRLTTVTAPHCEKCQSTKVRHTLRTEFADYWRCHNCGHIWSTDRAALRGIHGPSGLGGKHCNNWMVIRSVPVFNNAAGGLPLHRQVEKQLVEYEPAMKRWLQRAR
jgi:hypothetical protein